MIKDLLHTMMLWLIILKCSPCLLSCRLLSLNNASGFHFYLVVGAVSFLFHLKYCWRYAFSMQSMITLWNNANSSIGMNQGLRCKVLRRDVKVLAYLKTTQQLR